MMRRVVLGLRRDCEGGLCMRSPFNFANPSAYLPTDATLLWPAVADASVGAQIPGWRTAALQVTAENPLGPHTAMIGAPEIGPLVLARLRVGF